ncbi:phosphate/phosphite/phosphonate ABC transporter substrate-binding protein [Flagellimonas sp. 389]|uniref:phosphate/phosphite/phosphonate ABC transporter substrate-binding protein n=1 Tax=Flagellimonas sp. 389 TaxID=2835862 RepID=UPI001BD29A47|nr:PhnD/SsuA/transferrin family substrate-binding protein [Flagellimonas sp. 389]MBS9460928.1 phosphate/phosphite/phosphonate ABC transporter substrate-binding protein [Flagellimonas sp. 389]
MNRTRIIIGLLINISLFQTGCKKSTETLRVATYTYATNDRIDNLRPLSKKLEELLERPVETISYPDVTSFVKGIESNDVDVALINTLGYLELSLRTNTMEPIAALMVKKNAVDNYKTVLLTNNTGAKDLTVLKNDADSISIMFVNKESTSGNLVPRLLLSSIGIKSPEITFKEVKYGGNHSSTFNKLLKKETDVCAIGSNEYYKQIEDNTALLEQTKILWISEEIPLGPVLINSELSAREKKKITDLLLNLHEENPNALESIKKGWSEAKQADRFHPVTDSYYDDFRKINNNSTDLLDILELLKQ